MLNKTLIKEKAKIKSALKSKHFLTFCAVAIVLGASLVFIEKADDKNCIRSQNSSCIYKLEIADTPQKQEIGLSYRDNLAEDRAILFVFQDASINQTCFWMKGMRFNIDIIWLGSDKKIVKIKDNASPETYPEKFCPESPAKYVLELNAGEAKRQNYTVGSKIDF